MKNIHTIFTRAFSVSILLFSIITTTSGQITNVGSGSYTNTFPGVDVAGRNTFPDGTPFVSGVAATKPVPTNDWWSSKLKLAHVNNLFNYPLALRTVNEGLIVSFIEPVSGPNGSSQPMDDMMPIVVGVTGLNANAATVSDYSDFTVTMNWTNDVHIFDATVGIAMPFMYFTKNGSDIAQITINEGSVTISNEVLIIENSRQGADFAVYAPSGSSWTQNGNVYTSDLNNNDYWSMAYLPPSVQDVSVVAGEYIQYAYVFPTNTTTAWTFNESNSTVRTTFEVTSEVKEGAGTNVLLGLLPHQWSNLAPDSPVPDGYAYSSIRGEIKTLDANEFYIENTFYGILPTLPYLNNYSDGFSPSSLNQKIQLIENNGLSTWTDSYNEGQVMNRLVQTARIADLTGNTIARDKIISTIKDRLEDWLTAELGEVAFLFYYNATWTTFIGYPAGHGQDGNINDHHFHWGYFIHAAAFLEQFEPGWTADWGEMINYLVRDAASQDRNDTLFPFLRNFSPYAGHCWANGFATFPFGNDQESTSESMQFNSSLIHWGTVTGNDEIRDLGIYLYTTEQSAIEEYWFDVYDRTFKDGYNFSLASRIWGNGYDNQTFWTGDIAAAYGIEFYPIHGGSLYLGQNLDYIQQLWQEISVNTGILTNEVNANLWHDVMWEFLAFIDPESAIDLYDSFPERELKFGISDAQTYYWLHSMNALGKVDTSVTSNYPVSAVFDKDGAKTYVAHNYSNTPLIVTFSDGFSLDVPANKMATNRDIAISGILTPSFSQAFPGGDIDLEVTISGGDATRIAFYDGDDFIGEKTVAPFVLKAEDLIAGKHNFYARVYKDTAFNITNISSVIVGRQLPYEGSAFTIPGTIQAGFYDNFEGGIGQGISYNDVSVINEGGFRPVEYVDAAIDPVEGATVGWISSGEWLEYSVDVMTPGLYSMEFRYASGNNNGGGPFHLELDGNIISGPVTGNFTGDWDDWTTKTVNDIPLPGGEHILRLFFASGEINLGEMTFEYSGPLPYNQPVADAGENISVLLPESTATLDGTGSSDPGSEALSYEWTQVYGPSIIVFADPLAATTQLSGLSEGVYLIKLRVQNSTHFDEDELYVIVSATGNIAPTVVINLPANNSEYIEGKPFTISAQASDLDGSIEKVEFYFDEVLIGTSSSAPYSMDWNSSALGEHIITAEAADNGGIISTSAPVTITILEAPSCMGSSPNGDFNYLFSDNSENPTITFIPSQNGVGTPICILYYGTNLSQTFPGYGVTPNVPFTITAGEGETVYFYYTYSYPGEGERNNSANMNSYVIGTCISDNTGFDENPRPNIVSAYPNPVEELLKLEFSERINNLSIYNVHGKLINSVDVFSRSYEFDMTSFSKGIYFFAIRNSNNYQVIKVVKK